MIKTIAIVSLSRGILGEEIVAHEVALGLRRLEEYGIQVKFMPHALAGLDYVKNHPECRAQDLLEAFRDEQVDMILCAIGGDDTYRLLPYLFEDRQLEKAVCKKVFLGFSDTTMNHLMLHKVGLNTFYGQAFLPDLCELADQLLPYTRQYFEELLATGTISRVTPSPLWYEERTDWGSDQLGIGRKAHPNGGFRLLQGAGRFSGKLLGGCIESMYDCFSSDRYADTVTLCRKYQLFPPADQWKGRILLLETSEEKPAPALFRKMVIALREWGVFGAVNGVLLGKPQDETYEQEYHQALLEEIGNPTLPVVANISVGHATPRCILPFGVDATVDVESQCITFSTAEQNRENL